MTSMFVNQRRSTAGVGSIAAVAFVAIAWLFGTGLMAQTYREGAAIGGLGSGATCEFICAATQLTLPRMSQE